MFNGKLVIHSPSQYEQLLQFNVDISLTHPLYIMVQVMKDQYKLLIFVLNKKILLAYEMIESL